MGRVRSKYGKVQIFLDLVIIHANHYPLFLLNLLLKGICPGLDLLLYISLFDGCYRPAQFIDLGDQFLDLSNHLPSQRFYVVRSSQGVHGVRYPGFMQEYLLCPEAESD